jgi:hypothetical protein
MKCIKEEKGPRDEALPRFKREKRFGFILDETIKDLLRGPL